MRNDYSGWFAGLIRDIYDHRDNDRKVVFTEHDDHMAKQAFLMLESAEEQMNAKLPQ